MFHHWLGYWFLSGLGWVLGAIGVVGIATMFAVYIKGRTVGITRHESVLALGGLGAFFVFIFLSIGCFSGAKAIVDNNLKEALRLGLLGEPDCAALSDLSQVPSNRPIVVVSRDRSFEQSRSDPLQTRSLWTPLLRSSVILSYREPGQTLFGEDDRFAHIEVNAFLWPEKTPIGQYWVAKHPSDLSNNKIENLQGLVTTSEDRQVRQWSKDLGSRPHGDRLTLLEAQQQAFVDVFAGKFQIREDDVMASKTGGRALFRNIELEGVSGSQVDRLALVPSVEQLVLTNSSILDSELQLIPLRLPRLKSLDLTESFVSWETISRFQDKYPQIAVSHRAVSNQTETANVEKGIPATPENWYARGKTNPTEPKTPTQLDSTVFKRLAELNVTTQMSVVNDDLVITGILGAGSSLEDEDVALLTCFPEIRKLDLSDTRLSDRGLLKLASLSHLQELYVQGSKVTREGILRLQRAAPQIQMIVADTSVDETSEEDSP